MRLRAFAALWFFLPLGCTDDAPEPPKNVLNKPISFYTSCYGNIMFTNNTLDNFVITKIMRENKMRDASLIIENKKVWEYRGHPNAKTAHVLSRKVTIEPEEALICFHDGFSLTAFGHYEAIVE